MKRPPTNLLCILGLSIQGDLDGITCYRKTNGTIVWYPKAPPTKPPSNLQLWWRQQWSTWINDWKNLTDAQRKAWTNAANRAHLSVSGINLWIAWNATHDDAWIHTIERQTGITLL
jgi:hypothetical protein